MPKIGRRNITFNGLDLKGDAARMDRSKECEERGYHVPVRPSQLREMKAGPNQKVLLDLCRFCGVWVLSDRFLHDDLVEEMYGADAG